MLRGEHFLRIRGVRGNPVFASAQCLQGFWRPTCVRLRPTCARTQSCQWIWRPASQVATFDGSSAMDQAP